MDTDLALTIGMVIMALSLPSIISALTDGRAPRAGAIAVVIGGGLLVFAITNHPGGYQFSDLPNVFFRVLRRFL